MPAPTHVVMHPVVLLSVVDHYSRVVKDPRKRAVGVLLGEVYKGRVDVTNSYAIPFEEDDSNPDIFFVDHNYHENMYAMYKKVNAREQVVGWYSTGPKIRANDLAIHSVFERYTTHPAFVIVDVQPKEIGLPTDAYVVVSQSLEETSEPVRTFANIGSSMGALEAEEVGVEHLLRDIKDSMNYGVPGATGSVPLTQKINEKVTGLRALSEKLVQIQKYLSNVIEGKLPVNHAIMYELQNIFNLLPGVTGAPIVAGAGMEVEGASSAEKAQAGMTSVSRAMQTAMSTQTNDMLLVIYLSSLIRSVIGLHNLINNKVQLASKEKESEGEKEKEKEKEKNDKTKKAEAAPSEKSAQ